MAKNPGKPRITGGVDTHKDAHHAAVVLMNGRRLADAQFPATAAGNAGLLAWMRSFGRLHAAGVEGTGSYGAALARHLHSQDVQVIEVNRPDRRQRRGQGKSDPLDAYADNQRVHIVEQPEVLEQQEQRSDHGQHGEESRQQNEGEDRDGCHARSGAFAAGTAPAGGLPPGAGQTRL